MIRALSVMLMAAAIALSGVTRCQGLRAEQKLLEGYAAALERLMQTPAVFERNTGAIARGYRTQPYPAAWIRDELHARGKCLLWSSDCHDKKDLLFGFDERQEPYGQLLQR